ncbi:MAG: hypothetical protein ABI199_07765 [Bacteroidia bacterium]
MDKKELRKELEFLLIHSIENTLNKRDCLVTRKIRETTFEAAKIVAKKFYKSIKAGTFAKKKPLTRNTTKKMVKPSSAKAKK